MKILKIIYEMVDLFLKQFKISTGNEELFFSKRSGEDGDTMDVASEYEKEDQL